MLTKNIFTMNIAKGLIVNHLNAYRFIRYLENNQEIALSMSDNISDSISDNNALSGNWFHYILKTLSHCKEWIVALKNFYYQYFPNHLESIVEQTDEKGNTVFMTAVHCEHLKTALSLALNGSCINRLNNEGKSWVAMIDEQITPTLSKRKVIYYQKFIRKILSIKEIEDFSQQTISELIKLNEKITYLLKEFKKNSIRYEQYWNDVLIQSDEIHRILQAFFKSWKLAVSLPKNEIEEKIYKL